jgi:hypothetical protein
VLVWVVAAMGLAVGVVALGLTRRTARKLDALNQSYWELRYDYTRLRSQVARLDPESQESTPADPPQAPASVSFVPLSAIKSASSQKKD